jgi:hypothetical protein
MGHMLKWVVAGVGGGAVGAWFWAGITYWTHHEIGWIAWGIGVLVDMAIRMAAGATQGWAPGFTAAVIAVLAIIGGKICRDKNALRLGTSETHEYATKASLALMHWAYSYHGQSCFLLSISPQNLASTAMAGSLGFAACGSHVDDEDGLEIDYVRRFERWPPEWLAKMTDKSGKDDHR